MIQALEPELPHRRDLVALLGEYDRVERRQPVIAAYLCGHPQQQVGLPTAPGTDYEGVRIGIAIAGVQGFQESRELGLPDAERRHDLIVAEETGIVLLYPDDHAEPPTPNYRLVIEVKLWPCLARHQSSSRPDTKTYPPSLSSRYPSCCRTYNTVATLSTSPVSTASPR